MPKQEELNQELEKMQQRVRESEKSSEERKKSKPTIKIIRLILMYGALALILAVFVMALLRR